MATGSQRKNESLLRRIFRRHQPRSPKGLLAREDFCEELLKEIYRSDRRPAYREFALIRMTRDDSGSVEQLFETNPELLEPFCRRLRISDSIGWHDACLAVLLPETDKEGAMSVANDLAKMALHHDVKLDTELSIYPWDDELISLADELKNLLDKSNPDSNGSLKGPHHSSNGAGVESEPAKAPSETACVATDLVKEAKFDFVPSQPTPIWKRAIDITGSGIGLIMLSPLFLGAAVAIKWSSRGPVFFKQMREGKNGKPFGILKFRTMVLDAEAKQAELLAMSEQDGPAFKLENDPRITTVGRYLRKSCIDELPQLFNVLIGEMSLVGPRPLPVHESYGCTAWQRKRLTVLPGLTCIWQARGGRNVKFAEWMRMDLDYIEQRSFWFDLKLIFETAFIAIMHKGSV